MYRILIVDDEKMERDGVEFLIRRRSLPVRIRQAQNGREALDMWREEPDDIVFMDIKMPVKNGIELLQKHPGKQREYGAGGAQRLWGFRLYTEGHPDTGGRLSAQACQHRRV